MFSPNVFRMIHAHMNALIGLQSALCRLPYEYNYHTDHSMDAIIHLLQLPGPPMHNNRFCILKDSLIMIMCINDKFICQPS